MIINPALVYRNEEKQKDVPQGWEGKSMKDFLDDPKSQVFTNSNSLFPIRGGVMTSTPIIQTVNHPLVTFPYSLVSEKGSYQNPFIQL